MHRNKNYKLTGLLLTAGLAACGWMTGCGSSSSDTTASSASSAVVSSEAKESSIATSSVSSVVSQTTESEASSVTSEASSAANDAAAAPEIQGLTYDSTLQLDYADQYDVYFYNDGYAYIDIVDDSKYLLVPEGMDVPEGLDDSVVILQQPLNQIYDAATATVSLFSCFNDLADITMVSVNQDGWSFDSIKEAMDAGETIYAGKYSQPDYELLLQQNCNLAIESTMIYHCPEVKEMIEELGIPVLVDRSSYESNPMGRTEWIKLYGVITGHQQEAEDYFNAQKEDIDTISQYDNTGKTVAFFYISTDGKAVVRSTTDYIPTMINMAGGKYVFDGILEESGSSSVDMGMETFYNTAKDADILIYNGSIDSSVTSLEDLIEKNPIMKDFKAVQEGNCWRTDSAMYQRTDIISTMILDFHRVFAEEELDQISFLEKLD